MTVHWNGSQDVIPWLLLVQLADESAEQEPVITMIRTIRQTILTVGPYGAYKCYKDALKTAMQGVAFAVDDDDLLYCVRTSRAKQLETVTLVVDGVMISLILDQARTSKAQWMLRRLIEMNKNTTAVALLVNYSFDANNVSVECITA